MKLRSVMVVGLLLEVAAGTTALAGELPGVDTLSTVPDTRGATYALLQGRVTDSGNSPVTECGVCWGPTQDVSFVATKELGPSGQRCMRQIPCTNHDYAYYTSDGFMDQREYACGALYYHQAYAINSAGISYGGLLGFYAPGPATYDTNSYAHTNSAELWGLVDSMNDNVPGLTECGICWGTTAHPALVEQSSNATGDSVRCMRSFGCAVNRQNNAFWFYTPDGYQSQIDYLPGMTYNYRAYTVVDGVGIQYGKTAQFTVPITVVTGQADNISSSNARLAGAVTSYGPVKECGICWTDWPTFPPFVDSQQLGSKGQRCMRQIPCTSYNFAYYTSDGFMDQREYSSGKNYLYGGYAIDMAGNVYYGESEMFSVP